MEIVALLVASKYGVAALGTVTLAVGVLAGMLGMLAHKATREAPKPANAVY